MTDTIPVCWGCDGAGILATPDGEDAFECTICEGSGLADSAGGAILGYETDSDEGPESTDGDHGTCATCGGGIRYQACPTGGWWIHDAHPADGHDAALGGPA